MGPMAWTEDFELFKNFWDLPLSFPTHLPLPSSSLSSRSTTSPILFLERINDNFEIIYLVCFNDLNFISWISYFIGIKLPTRFFKSQTSSFVVNLLRFVQQFFFGFANRLFHFFFYCKGTVGFLQKNFEICQKLVKNSKLKMGNWKFFFRW